MPIIERIQRHRTNSPFLTLMLSALSGDFRHLLGTESYLVEKQVKIAWCNRDKHNNLIKYQILANATTMPIRLSLPLDDLPFTP